ncbi:hypothetical protein BT96DRAFT_1052271 [Gymnopus androsaceus JB14]|uniref:Rhodanese domain-containing protein n=1 Tax=Gymnopus androsaceus JB14 TaxID=1447944 RepID=A0A6A4GAR6_9AGAR|nr:hypothetical protein BT96DRAFT_1052271 [Gymnopus androsaceus JB14]
MLSPYPFHLLLLLPQDFLAVLFSLLDSVPLVRLPLPEEWLLRVPICPLPLLLLLEEEEFVEIVIERGITGSGKSRFWVPAMRFETLSSLLRGLQVHLYVGLEGLGEPEAEYGIVGLARLRVRVHRRRYHRAYRAYLVNHLDYPHPSTSASASTSWGVDSLSSAPFPPTSSSSYSLNGPSTIIACLNLIKSTKSVKSKYLTPNSPKKTATPCEWYGYLRPDHIKVIVLDLRERTEFDRVHIHEGAGVEEGKAD